MEGKTFAIIPANERIHPSDVEFREYASHIKKVLAIEGAREVKDIKEADLCILMHYEIIDESYDKNDSAPVFGETNIRSIAVNPYSSSPSLDVRYSQGITGYRNIQRRVSVFSRTLNLSAFENVENGSMVWKTTIKSRGSNGNLREIIPILAYVAIGKIGIDCEEVVDFKSEGNKTFSDFEKLKIEGKNLFVAPKIDYYYADERIRIISIEEKDDETIITFYKKAGVESIYISPKMFLEFAGSKIYPFDANNITLGKNTRNNRGFFFSIHYPRIYKDVTSVNLSEEEDLKMKERSQKKYWTGIRLVK